LPDLAASETAFYEIGIRNGFHVNEQLSDRPVLDELLSGLRHCDLVNPGRLEPRITMAQRHRDLGTTCQPKLDRRPQRCIEF
jgi:hypothetical protein